MRQSKYLNKQFDNGWKCTHVGVARVQGTFYKGTRIRAGRAGHRTYYYVFERVTSDNKAEKMIRLDAKQAAQVYRGEVLVEDLLTVREEDKSKQNKFTNKVSYHFF